MAWQYLWVFFFFFFLPAAVAEWVERLCSEREIPHSNPGILPLLSSACRECDGPHASKKECRREIHSGFETREEGHTKSKTGAISGSTNWALVQQKFKKKKKKKKYLWFFANKLYHYKWQSERVFNTILCKQRSRS